jgi:hypothetical protein
MDENKDRNLIYQYVFHNYDNEYHMMAELKRMMKDYYLEIISGDYYFDYDKFDSFSNGDLILKDIIPPIIKSTIVDIKLSDFKDENDLCSHANDILAQHIGKVKKSKIQYIFGRFIIRFQTPIIQYE